MSLAEIAFPIVSELEILATSYCLTVTTYETCIRRQRLIPSSTSTKPLSPTLTAHIVCYRTVAYAVDSYVKSFSLLPTFFFPSLIWKNDILFISHSFFPSKHRTANSIT